jgi:hypothetical protein
MDFKSHHTHRTIQVPSYKAKEVTKMFKTNLHIKINNKLQHPKITIHINKIASTTIITHGS